jgi:hypothetical protein
MDAATPSARLGKIQQASMAVVWDKLITVLSGFRFRILLSVQLRDLRWDARGRQDLSFRLFRNLALLSGDRVGLFGLLRHFKLQTICNQCSDSYDQLPNWTPEPDCAISGIDEPSVRSVGRFVFFHQMQDFPHAVSETA